MPIYIALQSKVECLLPNQFLKDEIYVTFIACTLLSYMTFYIDKYKFASFIILKLTVDKTPTEFLSILLVIILFG